MLTCARVHTSSRGHQSQQLGLSPAWCPRVFQATLPTGPPSPAWQPTARADLIHAGVLEGQSAQRHQLTAPQVRQMTAHTSPNKPITPRWRNQHRRGQKQAELDPPRTRLWRQLNVKASTEAAPPAGCTFPNATAASGGNPPEAKLAAAAGALSSRRGPFRKETQ